MDAESLLREYRKKPIFDISGLPEKVDYGPECVKKILPHREPFLLIDHITGMDIANGLISGDRFLRADDPVFTGHFPGTPIYPGVLEIEMAGQMGLCMQYFLSRKTSTIDDEPWQLNVRATRIAGALFLLPVSAGTTVTILAKRLSSDDFTGSVLGQVLDGTRVACVCVGEVAFL